MWLLKTELVNESIPLQILINYIFANYFNDCYSVCLFRGERTESLSLHFGSTPMVIIKSPNGNNLENNPYDAIEEGVNLGCKTWLLDASITNLFMDIYELITSRTSALRPVRPKFLVFGFEAKVLLDANPSQVSSILNHPLMKNVPDVLLILPSGQDNDDQAPHFDLLTSKSVGRHNNSTPVLIETVRINSSDMAQAVVGPEITFKFGHRELYSRRKLFNLQDRHLALATFYYRPCSTVTEVEPGTGNADGMTEYVSASQEEESNANYPEKNKLLDGTEGTMVLEFCKKYNCTILLVEEDGTEWGEVFDNFTGTGILGSVAMKVAEVAVTSTYMWYHEYNFMEWSFPLTRSGTTALVPKPKIINSTLIALMPFSGYVWLAYISSFVIISVTLRLIEFIQFRIDPEDNEDSDFIESTFYVYQIFFEQTVIFKSLLFAKNILIILMLIEGFVMSSVFAGSLLSFLAVPRYEPPIDTQEDLAHSGVRWSATHNAWIYSIMDTDNPITMKVRDQFVALPRNVLEDMNGSGTLGYAIEALDYGYYVFNDYIAPHTMELLRPMKGDIIYGPIVGGMQRCWYLTEEFNGFLLLAAQFGFQKYWLLEITYRQLNPSVQRLMMASKSHPNDPETAEPLKIGRMAGIFYLLVIGLTAAFIVFALELLSVKYVRSL